MVCAVELFLAHVTLERFLFAVDVFVARKEVTPISGVGTVCAAIAFCTLIISRGVGPPATWRLKMELLLTFLVVSPTITVSGWWRRLHFGLQPL